MGCKSFSFTAVTLLLLLLFIVPSEFVSVVSVYTSESIICQHLLFGTEHILIFHERFTFSHHVRPFYKLGCVNKQHTPCILHAFQQFTCAPICLIHSNMVN